MDAAEQARLQNLAAHRHLRFEALLPAPGYEIGPMDEAERVRLEI